ncbi:MAG: tRNA preQ1(34) S-adenosylmethionine ribosyltransferase-isomerase QueA [Planctomycetota bacterium]
MDYDLPERLIAQVPAPQRTDSRLLVLDRSTGRLQDRRFAELAEILDPTDLLVLNNTRVVPAKFRLLRSTGGRIDGLFLQEQVAGVWEVMLRNASRLRRDEPLTFVSRQDARRWTVHAGENLGQGRWTVRVEPAEAAADILASVGRAPLPPYIRRAAADDAHDRLDAERYQTVYAKPPGAVAAPTAGLHFTEPLLDDLAQRGVDRVEVTLHVGMGTFAPVTVDDLARHPMHAEWYALDPPAAERINRHRANGGRIVAVGTTSVRVLESCVDAEGRVRAGSGWTRKFCYPPYHFRGVDALLTNFHLPRSTLLALVMAFAGVEPIRRAYRHAVAQEYRFFSYGDAMFIG